MVSVYDTMQREIVDVRPADGSRLTMYSCGPTVYRYAHIGNLRTFLMADLLRRAFEYTGTEVHQVQNITDVGHMTDELFGEGGRDRMEIAVEVEGRSAQEIAEFYTNAFFDDVSAFNIKRAAAYPKASDHIPQMIEIIAKLIERGHAYETGGTVYYAVESFPRYGALSGNTLDALVADHRKEIGDTNKRHHADFVLWMNAGPNRMIRFPSPWGDGYPGWHIECSAMSMAHFGDSFDLHTGGEDNVFPHHEDEIAQSDGSVGHSVVRHWVHGAHLLSEGRKMAKSSQNFYELRDLLEQGHTEPLAARLLFMQSRYRAQMNFTLESLTGAERALERWRRQVANWASQPVTDADTSGFDKRFRDAVCNDLDTPTALALVSEVMGTEALARGDKAALLMRWDAFLGLDLAREVGRTVEVPQMVLELIEQRERARTKKDFSSADRIRHKILSLGFEVEDTAEGPKPRPRAR
ncbi:MAG TPA: cysteine--tRNA ligase [Actinomycetota bacterium]|nr:cysteine--tRNA ligase [Actinomycetota bacterium]